MQARESPGTSTDPIAEARRQWEAHGWRSAAPGMAMVTSLVRVHQLLMERIEATLRPTGLTFARFELLRLLDFTRTGEMAMSRIGSLLQVHPASVTSAVDRLVAQGFVARGRDPRDGRVVLATITSAGRAVVAEATALLNAAVFNGPGLPADDLEALTGLLTRIRAHHGDPVTG